ncbi:MAG: gliding motility-associated C-terminal domain-containing protein [Bacteroidota bacterium]|nr:gliding motility-associated C-terminal domain-containing protein [Bacteroidota bacterium]
MLFVTKSELFAQVKKEQSIDFENLSDVTCKDSILSLKANATSGLPVSFKVIGGRAKISDNQITLLGIGNISVMAFQNGNDQYYPADAVINNFNVKLATKEKMYVNLNNSFCSGDTITAFVSKIQGIKNIWTTNNNQKYFGNKLTIPNAEVSMSGKYFIQYYENTCAIFENNGLEFIIKVKPKPSVQFEDFNKNIFTSTLPFQIRANPKGGTLLIDGSSYESVITPSILGIGIHNITYTYKDTSGCESSINESIKISYGIDKQQISIKIYDLITPDNDGKNDFFWVDNIEYFTNNEVSIFNKWGLEIFKSANYKNDWTPLDIPDGSYTYLVKIKDLDKTFQGGLFIIR